MKRNLKSSMLQKFFPFFFACSVVLFSPSFTHGDSQQKDEIVINFGGDCTFASHFENYVGEQFDFPFAKLKWFSEADISMVNLENPITTRGVRIPKEFNFRMHPKYLQVLMNGGVDIVTVANNHVFDYGSKGVFDTISYLDSVGIKHVGAGRNIVQARQAVVFDIRGVRIGFLGYWGNGGRFLATASRAGAAPCHRTYIEEDVKRLKEVERADIVIVNYHWGKELAHYPSKDQIGLGRFTIDAGADLVIGHHPHVLQGIEKYKQGIIVYSLGNLIFGGNERREYRTAVFQVRIRGKQIVPQLIPVHVSHWQPYLLDGKEGDRVLREVKGYSKIFKQSIF